MRVLFTPLAERQIGALYDYIAERAGERRAEAYIRRILVFCDGMATFRADD